MTKLEMHDRLSHYQAFARRCQQAANTAALAAQNAERRYARANQLCEEIERQIKEMVIR